MLKHKFEIIGKQKVRNGDKVAQIITFEPFKISSGLVGSGEFSLTIEDKNIYDSLPFGMKVNITIEPLRAETVPCSYDYGPASTAGTLHGNANYSYPVDKLGISSVQS